MKMGMSLVVIATVLAIVWPHAVRAEVREIEPGVFFDDFEDGKVDGFGVTETSDKGGNRLPGLFETVKDEGKPAVQMKGNFQTRVFLQDRQFEDFSLTVNMKKTKGSYAGVVVREHWRVYFQMKGFVCLNSDAPGLVGGLLFQSDKAFKGYHKLKVVCAGPMMHVYVDDEPIFSRKISTLTGRVGFYAHHAEGFYRDIRIDTHVDPTAYLAVEPQADNDALVFAPGENAKLRFAVGNHAEAAQKVTVTAAVTGWDDAAKPVEMTKEVSAEKGETMVGFDAGRVPAGFHRVIYSASSAGKEICRFDDLPLAVQERGAGEFKPPLIPVAAYSKYFNKRKALYQNTYAHATGKSLKDHHFNAIVADPAFTRELVDIFQSYGIATIARTGRFVDHPAVIATLISDEPKPDQIDALKAQYDKMRLATDKPVTTCMVGEGIGLGGERDPVRIWEKLGPGLRCFRWYGIKKSFYGLLHDLKYKGVLPLASVLRIAEASSDTPWWFVPPSFGRTDHEGYFKNPSAAEMRGLMHLALAYGTDGLLLWCLQSHGRWPALIEQKSIAPCDGKYAAAAEVARLVNTHAELLASLHHAGLDIRCPNPAVAAVPVQPGDKGPLHVYAVNKDTKNPVTTRLQLWDDVWDWTKARDIFSGKDLVVQPRDEEGYLFITITIEPGDAMLIETDAVVNRKR